ncbi:hypothetical protein [Marinisporobacter balticus]|uniref:Uncharacterized protein n=1 Tax=Marinisporobacter balticus TaxID=2018667 RepID=A0A4V2SA73_9FIRM|nr:hypothetical protein [Marinisporobacter balticus]TCO70640.1 hypothetical protein EV214_12510 [Marinisporobacter balticus]
MKKKIISLFLVLTFVFALSITSFASSHYADVYSFSNIQPREERVVKTLEARDLQKFKSYSNIYIGTVEVEGNNLKYDLRLKGPSLSIGTDYFATPYSMHYCGQPFDGNGPYRLIIKNKGGSPISGRLILIAN